MSSTQQALEQRDQHPAAVLQRQYAARLAALVPSHVNGEAWVRQATGALRAPELAAAAQSDFGSFVSAVERAAVLGLRPGSEEFYLVPRKVKGRAQVMGIVGWQGLVDLMYRSGAVSSVVAEVVRQVDRFDYQPGRDSAPRHVIDWDAEDRGDLRLVYAYAVMKDGAHSKVVVLNRSDIDRIKQSSDGAGSPYSPWVKHEAAMWLKSAVRQLAKWIPTSTEYIAQRAQAEAVAARVTTEPAAAPAAGPGLVVLDGAGHQTAIGPSVNTATGELLDDPAVPVEDPPGGDDFDPTVEPGFGGQ